jgi:two-component system OmpR family response regulator
MQLRLVEDDLPLANSLKQALQKSGYAVNHVASRNSALHTVKVERPDIVILNIGLPDIDGIAVLKNLRLTDKSLPLLLLTARDGVDDKVAGGWSSPGKHISRH